MLIMKSNDYDKEKCVSKLTDVLSCLRSFIIYVPKRYFGIPLKINRDYKSLKSDKVMRIIPNFNDVYMLRIVDFDRIESIDYFKDAVKNFINVLEKKIPKENLSNFYYNINTFSIGELKNDIKQRRRVGFYNGFDNHLKVRIDYIYAIYHELFHLASCRYYGNNLFSGFRITNSKSKSSIGIGINEGYTQLLTERYFNNDRTINFLENKYGKINADKVNRNYYSFQLLIASKLENIVGKEKMEKLYLSSNLFGLVSELCQYASKEDVKKFITNMDFLHGNINYVYKYNLKNEKLFKAFLEVSDFLIRCYRKKMIKEHGKNFVYKDEYIQNYINDLNNFYEMYFSRSNTSEKKKRS